jgi:hypothetical protein
MGWIRRPKQSPFDVDSTKDRRTSRARKVERSHRAGGANDAGRNKTRRRRNDTERANEEKGEEGRAWEVSQRAYSLREVEESSIIAVSSVLALSSCPATQIFRVRGKLTGPTVRGANLLIFWDGDDLYVWALSAPPSHLVGSGSLGGRVWSTAVRPELYARRWRWTLQQALWDEPLGNTRNSGRRADVPGETHGPSGWWWDPEYRHPYPVSCGCSA